MAGEPDDFRRLLEEEHFERIRNHLSGMRVPKWKKALSVLYWLSPLFVVLILAVFLSIELGIHAGIFLFLAAFSIFVLIPLFFVFLNRFVFRSSGRKRWLGIGLCLLTASLLAGIFCFLTSYLSTF